MPCNAEEKATIKKTHVGGRTFFQLACEDMARFTSMISFDSDDIVKPRHTQGVLTSVYAHLKYFQKAGYLVVFGGFVPYYFKVLPFKLFQVWSILNNIWRKKVLSPLLRLLGYGKVCSWDNEKALKSLTLDPSSADARPYPSTDLTVSTPLAAMQCADPELCKLTEVLCKKGAISAPHSQATPNPFTAVKQILFGKNFPGNFFDHLVGVWKALAAWDQPQYVCRGGFFHSVYGTNQYRAGLWTYYQRDELSSIIGTAPEEIAFLICTAERSDLCHTFTELMYGKSGGKIRPLACRKSFLDFYKDPNNTMVATLPEEGIDVTNHITGCTHRMAPRVVAAFTIVMICDFLEQGVSSMAVYEDDDIMFFQYIKLRYWADVIKFISPWLDVVPTPFKKHKLLSVTRFSEPDRGEILLLKRLWKEVASQKGECSKENEEALREMVRKYSWIPEPMIVLAVITLTRDRKEALNLANTALECIRDWGMLHLKEVGHNRDAIKVIEWVQQQ